jgi:hypothetical protein
MSYHPHSIQMTRPQAIKLAKGETIRIPHAHLSGGHVVHMTKTQIKKIHKAHGAGLGVQLKLSPAAIRHNRKHGSGIFGDILRQVVGNVAPKLLNYGAQKLGDAIQGSGFFDTLKDVAKAAAPVVLKAGAKYAGNAIQKSLLGGCVQPSHAGRKRKEGGSFLPIGY